MIWLSKFAEGFSLITSSFRHYDEKKLINRERSLIVRKEKLLSLLGVGLAVCLVKPHLLYANPTFGGGNGTESNPYRLSTPEHLTELQVAVDGGNSFNGKYFVLTDHIDFSGYDNDNDPTNGNFDPIGYWYYRNNQHTYQEFQGHLDGQSYEIKNLKIILPDEEYVGLFAAISDGSIKNVKLKNVELVGKRIVGGLAGGSESLIENCSVEGGFVKGGSYDQTGYPTYASGGLVGYNEQLISNSYTNVMVQGDRNVGGLVGISLNEFYEFIEAPWHDIVETTGRIQNSYALGNVIGNTDVGGLVGWNSSPVVNSYAKGNVEGKGYVGGLVGSLEGGKEDWSYPGATEYFLNRGNLEDCYYWGSVKGEAYVGGLAGWASAPISKSYAIGKVSGETYVGGLAGYSFKGQHHDDSSLIGNFSLTESFANNEVVGTTHVGGLLGFSSGSQIKNAYHLQTVRGNENVGGVLGTTISGNYQTQILNTYQGGEVVGQVNVGDLLGVLQSVTHADNSYHIEVASSSSPLVSVTDNNSQINNLSRIKATDLIQTNSADLFEGFDFNTTWEMNNYLPRFQWEDTKDIPQPTDAMIMVTGTIQALMADVTIPSVSPDLVIDPNLPDGAVSPEFSIENQSTSPIKLDLRTFEQTTSTFNDVLPDKYDSWEGLNKKESQDIALGLIAKEGEGWQHLTTQTSYVAGHSEHEIGVIKPTSRVNFEFDVHHGRAFSESKTVQYRMVFVFDLLN